VKYENNNIVYLKDIGYVEFDYKERQSYARLEGKPVVMVDVIKRSGENLLIITEKIDKVLEKARESVFPDDLHMVITNDQSKRTLRMVNNLENSIIFGVILVVITLLFFLGTRNAMFVGVAIPLSMFMSFMILGVFGITINMMVLFSLIMALGMLVDNGIVVVENVYRLREKGMGAMEATKKGCWRSSFAHHCFHCYNTRGIFTAGFLAGNDGAVYEIPSHYLNHYTWIFPFCSTCH
jgi:multidrug efflux pump subunit AcrB